MLFFKRILNFKKETVEESDQRKTLRHAVGSAFPFKAVLTLIGHDDEGNPLPAGGKGQDWTGRLTNLSATGASIQLHSAAAGIRGEPCRFKLSLDKYRLEIPGTIAHFRPHPQYMLCGFSFNFPDFVTQKAYLQLLEPVSIGATLAPLDPKLVRQDTAGLYKEQFRGIATTLLNVWREAPGGELYSFDFRMKDYGVRWSKGMTEVEAYGMVRPATPSRQTATPFIHLTETQREEVHWLFCLAVPNLAKAVPSDVRKFLVGLVA